jgi:hypothetical protein
MAKMLYFDPCPAATSDDALPPEFSKRNAYKNKEGKSSPLFRYEDLQLF